MIIYHDADLNVSATLSIYPDDYDPRVNGDLFVRHHEVLPPHLVHLEKGEDGVVSARRKVEMDLVYSADRIALGEVVTIQGVPPGAAIAANGAPLGTMDDSGALQIEPETTGFFKLAIECAGYITEEIALEVVRVDRP